MIAGFPIPIIFALAIHYTNNRVVKKTVQMATYIPHFISVVVIVGIINQLFSSRGIVNQVIEALGMGNVDFLGSPKVFPHLYVWSGIWQSFGYSSIIYISTLSGVDPNQHEAAMIDGANKLQRMRYIDIPAILPTMVTLLILNSGRILEVRKGKSIPDAEQCKYISVPDYFHICLQSRFRKCSSVCLFGNGWYGKWSGRPDPYYDG